MLSVTNLKPWRKILYKWAPYEVLKYDHHAMWRGGSVVNIQMKNLLTGSNISDTLRDSDVFEEADVHNSNYEYLYADPDNCFFMNTETYEQVELSKKIIWDNIYYLTEWGKVMLQIYDSLPINIQLEPSAVIEVTDTPPWEKWDTATWGKKPATLVTGLVVQVPLFINIWDKIRVDTRTKGYMSRA